MERCVAIPTGNGETQWIERCRSGDREPFRLLYDAYKDRVYSFALYTLNGDAAMAEDVTQEVFVRVFQRIAGFRREAEFTTWLYRIAANACIDELRRRKRVAAWGDCELPAALRADFHRVELSTAIRGALAELPAEQRPQSLQNSRSDSGARASGWNDRRSNWGADVGALVGGLMALGIPKDQALKYQSRLEVGEFLVVVHGTPDQVAQT